MPPMRHAPSQRPGFLLTLPAGNEVFLGPVLPEDSWRLRRGLEGMSPRSRYLRFFTGLRALSDEQVRYFTEVDQVNHVAWGALDVSQPDWPGVAIARFARLEDQPEKAEWAIAIIDAFQRKGLGRVLLAILYLLAEQRGIESLVALVLPENRFVLNWLKALGATVRYGEDAFEIELPVDREGLRRSATDPARHLVTMLQQVGPRVAVMIDE